MDGGIDMEKLEVLNRNIEVFLTDMMSKDDYNHLHISVNLPLR